MKWLHGQHKKLTIEGYDSVMTLKPSVCGPNSSSTVAFSSIESIRTF